jgi:hypothetical protein
VITALIPVYFSMNGYLFQAVAGGTTAAAFIGFSAFNLNQFGVTTDGSVKWMCLGRQALVRAHISNSSGSAASPAAQEYDLFLA